MAEIVMIELSAAVEHKSALCATHIYILDQFYVF